MVLLSLTASHRELDLDALERLSMGSASVGRTVVGTCRPVVGAVVISTCNRFELYLDVDAPLDGTTVGHATRHVAELVAGESGVTTQAAVDSFTVRTGSEVTEHLFAVAAGLDSMVVGEREIAGQVKRSLAVAREQETTSKTLELLFQTASRTSKRVGTHTELGAAGRSVVSLALDLAETQVPRWDGARAVLIGTGSYAGASVAALRARGCADIRVYSQSGRAAQFAASHGVEAVDDLVEALADADVVVSCSGARGRGPRPGTTVPHDRPAPEASLGHVLDAAAVVRARERAADRAGDEPEPRALVVLDLALHRDVDPQVADVEGVLLYDLASLKAHAPAVALDVVGHARGIVDDAARAFEENRLGREADAAVITLLDEAEARVRAEAEDAVARFAAERAAAGNPGPTPQDADDITRAIRRRIHAELHPRIVAARAEARARAKAQEAAVIEGAESITRHAGTAHRPTS
ncbi:glutamyl-tRNA reductase [Myceligenerans salitolerans]|uniref:Glutamyl-tRNA reductase n=1 Tax=Myceligenerans salitolerans TaxID=1230528 RepID=A0ABS3I9Q2_9MICO|nr:glutamyl-tRNA reductase [Myceligenerans salitolerans]MBO0609738.1 glutamyl-tRNA reductase [Myceligenerans salitolerans]